MAMKTRQDLAREAHMHLSESITAAHLILSSMNAELCDASLWPSSNHHPPRATASSDPSDSNHVSDLDEARQRYKSSVAALRASINAIFAFSSEENDKFELKSNQSQIDRLEAQASSLRKEIEGKNKDVKILIDQLRNLINDISMWQSPRSL